MMQIVDSMYLDFIQMVLYQYLMPVTILMLTLNAGFSKPKSLGKKSPFSTVNETEDKKLTIAVVTEWQPNNTESPEKAWIFSNTAAWISENKSNLIPLLPWYSLAVVKDILLHCDGIIFMGGMRDLKINNQTDEGKGLFERYSSNVLEIAKENNIPILAICQGFQLISSLEAEKNILTNFKNANAKFTNDIFTGKTATEIKKDSLFSMFNADDIKHFQENQVNYHYHGYGYSVEDFNKSKLSKNYEISSVGIDEAGKEFVNSIYHKQFPIHAVQYHPERANMSGDNKNLGEDYKLSREISKLQFQGFKKLLLIRFEGKGANFQINDEFKQKYLEFSVSHQPKIFNSFYGLFGYEYTKTIS